MRWWTSRCSLTLCLVKAPLAPSLLFASYRRSASQLTNNVTLPLSTLRKPSIMFQGRSYGGPQRRHWVAEWAVRVIQGMYSNAQRSMQVNSQCNYEFGMGVHVHQDSALSPLLFVPVLEALSHEFSIRVPWELLHNDDLLLITNSQEKCISKLKAWKAGMESRELHVSMKKTK